MNRMIVGGAAAALAVAVAAGSVFATGTPTVAAMPTTGEHVVAAGVTETVARLEEEARIRAEEEARARAEAEARAKAEAARKRANSSSQSRPSGGSGSTVAGNPNWEATRLCIMRKESGGNYRAVSPNGLYHGAYQFSRPTSDATAKRMGRPDLVGIPASQWSPADQDAAFWTLWDNGRGRSHWPTAKGC